MLIKVKVFPGAKKDEVEIKANDSFEVIVREKAERGLANKAVVNMLAAYFKVPASRVRLIKGFNQKNKIFDVSYDK